MSRQNKVNKGQYDQAGRLAPDDLARERMKQQLISGKAKGKGPVSGPPHAHEGPGPNRPRSVPEE